MLWHVNMIKLREKITHHMSFTWPLNLNCTKSNLSVRFLKNPKYEGLKTEMLEKLTFLLWFLLLLCYASPCLVYICLLTATDVCHWHWVYISRNVSAQMQFSKSLNHIITQSKTFPWKHKWWTHILTNNQLGTVC